MPKLKKLSMAQRKLKIKVAVHKYRERNGDIARERNRIALSLRRTNEEYRTQERLKNRESQRKRRFCKFSKEKYGTQRQLLDAGNNNVIKQKLPSFSENNHGIGLIHSINNHCTYNDNRFLKIENFYFQADFQRTMMTAQIDQNYPYPVQISLSSTDLCLPIPLKKSKVSECDNNTASSLNQDTPIQSLSNTDDNRSRPDLLNATPIKTQMKIEPTQICGEDSKDLDSNVIPTDFLIVQHNYISNNEINQQKL